MMTNRFVIRLALCVFLAACKKDEPTDVATVETSITTAAETVPSPTETMNTTTVSDTSGSVVTATVEAPPADVPATDTSAPKEPFVPDPPPAEKPQTRPRYNYVVDTFYAWPADVAAAVARRASGVEFFTYAKARRIIAKRKSDGYEVVGKPVKIAGVRTSPPEPFNFSRTVVVYRKRVN